MDIKLEIDNEVIILKLLGNLVAGTADGLTAQIAKLTEKNYRFILLDLGKVDFIDSSGLGACISIKRDLAVNAGLLACTGLNENVRKVFRMTHADQKIMIFDARQEAVNVMLERIRTAGRAG